MPASLRAGGDDEARGDVAQTHLLVAQVEGHGQHVAVGYPGTADGLAAPPRGLVAFEASGRGIELAMLAEELKASDVGLEFLTGELKGSHGPSGIVFTVLAARSGMEREYIRDRGPERADPCRTQAGLGVDRVAPADARRRRSRATAHETS
ncbi:hypothetical protein ABZ953_36215 [Streptomyces sp. NPDC046465]|uniref:hypothetical protein n=1 Tax=Streptomyces sp. NPDC046465 TaxID=3155810 RepID=UPI003404C851